MTPPNIDQWRACTQLCINDNPDVKDYVRTSLVLAMIWQESSGNQYAYRFEPDYQYFWDPTGKKPLFNSKRTVAENRAAAQLFLGWTEVVAQSASFGLMQLMGAAARERGMKDSLLALTDPRTGVTWGIKHLWAWGYQNGKRSTEEALTRWNGGATYANEVIAKQTEIEKK